MWFDENEKRTCIDCHYGDIDKSKICEKCLSIRCEKGIAYKYWQPIIYSKGRVFIDDLFVQWNSRFGEKLAFSKCNLLDIKKRFARNCKLLYKIAKHKGKKIRRFFGSR